MKEPLIFISHSSKDKEQVRLIAELLGKINLIPGKQVFCSSLPGFDIPIDTKDRIFDFLRNSFIDYDIHVIFIHSHNYYKSVVCLNEMGAAWALKSTYTSILLPGFNFSEMKGVIDNGNIAIKLDNDVSEVKHKLNTLRKQLEEEFRLSPIPDIIWEEARDLFIEQINRKCASSQSPNVKDNKISSSNVSDEKDTSKSELLQILDRFYNLTVEHREAFRNRNGKLVMETLNNLGDCAQELFYYAERNENTNHELSNMASEVKRLFDEYYENYRIYHKVYLINDLNELYKRISSLIKKAADKTQYFMYRLK